MIKTPIRETGRVLWFNDNLGYGYIRRNDGSRAYIHHKEISGEGFKVLWEGQLVEYKLIQNKNGYEATNLISLE